ncbi:hypothetical protein NDU88_000706 [Pleurodeles waltl]|uniref:Uncharacterized protein n=1 Tax=Pleurodeles waltl TaxID=8319 RepID=A0AAV7THY7_PLEWA|nr:hypothetical protein NDU88_000706 [Pleurodeles waltl]
MYVALCAEKLSTWLLMLKRALRGQETPELREKPIEWYQQTDRFVKLAKCLWEDLNILFDIVVPADLFEECKRAIDWPTKEPERDKDTGAPSPETNSDEEEEDRLEEEEEMDTVDEEYPLITLYPMLTEADIPADLQETVGKEVWDMTGKEIFGQSLQLVSNSSRVFGVTIYFQSESEEKFGIIGITF